MLNIKILTLFPELYPGPLGASLCGNALKNNLWNLEIINIRDFTEDIHKTVDDKPFGGGAGMVLKADILAKAIDSITLNSSVKYDILYPSPRGNLLTQKKVVEFVEKKNILVLCGRYEGIDERIIEEYQITEFSIGDYVLSGGEIPSYVLIDSMVRLLPNVLGNSSTLNEESFSVDSNYEHLLEYPLYTRPSSWRGKDVPSVLLSGNHQKILEWQLKQAKNITKERRPDLWKKYINQL